MVAYKDILNTFGGDTSYADRYQAAMLKGDMDALYGITNEYKASQGGTTAGGTPTPTTGATYNQGNNLGNWNYGEDTERRQQEIVSNLNEAYANNPEQFKDWSTFTKNFNYDYEGRSDKERDTMMRWYNNTMGGMPDTTDYNNVNNTDYFLSQLVGGNQLQGTGAAATAAMNRYKDYQSLSGMTPEQIASAVSSNSINPVGQSMIDLKNYSPALYAQVQSILQNQTQIDDINAAGKGIYEGLTKTESNSNYTKYNFTDEYAKNASVIKQYNESLYKKIEGLGGDTAAYVSIVASMLQNPLIQANKDEIENIEGEIKKIQENIYTIGDSVREKLGSEAPEDLVSAYISQQTKQLQNQLRTAQNSLLVAQGKLDNQLSEVETMIDAINNGIQLEGGTSGSSDYQFISATKYQPAGYFNKKTGEFIPLSGNKSGGTSGGGTVTKKDNYNYQDDSEARLKQIASNLESLYKSNPELFKDRGTFNDYFKYDQRSQKQKNVLNSYWLKYGNWMGQGVGGVSGGESTQAVTESNDKWRALMNGILAGDVAGGYGKTAMKPYGFARELNEQEVMRNISLICTPSEYSALLKKLGTGAKNELNSAISDRIDDTIDANATKIKNRLDSIKGIGKKSKRDEEAKKLAKELGINFGDQGREGIIAYYNSL